MRGDERMKKLRNVIMLICLVFGMSAAAYAEVAEYPWIYETFSSFGKTETDGANLAILDEALEVSIGANITNGGGGFKIPVNLKAGDTYKLSFFIRLADGANIPRRDSGNNSYNEDGEIAKLYGVIKEGTSIKHLDFGEPTYWSNSEYILVEHEFLYEGDGAGASFSLRVGERSDRGGRNLQGGAKLIYYIDEIRLIPVSDTELVANLDYGYVENESNMIYVSYEFLGTENNSIAVLMCEDNGVWKTHSVLSVGEDRVDFEIPSDISGKNCKIAVYPADGTASGAVCEKTVNDLKLNVLKEFAFADEEITAEVTLCYPSQKHIMVIICQYSDDNEMLDIKYQSVECDNNEEKTVNLKAQIKEGTKKANLMIWEGSDFKTSGMVSIVEQSELRKEDE